MSFLDSLGIDKKIFGGFVVLLLLISIVGIVSYTSFEKISKTNIPMLSKHKDLVAQMHEMRRYEKDWLQRDTKNAVFLATGKSTYIDQLNHIYSNLILTLDEINTLQGDTNDGREDLIAYKQAFDLRVSKWREKGTFGFDYGFEGNAKKDKEDLFAIIQNEIGTTSQPDKLRDLQSIFLEYELLLDRETAYESGDPAGRETDFNALKTAVQKFNSLVRSSSLSESTKSQFVSKSNSFLANREAVFNLDKEIGLTIDDGLTDKLRVHAQSFTTFTVSDAAEVEAATEREIQNAVILIVTVVIACFIVGLSVAQFLSKTLSKTLSDAADQISSASKQLYSSASSVSSGVQQVATTIEQIAKGASHQSQLTEKGNTASKKAAETLSDIRTQTGESVNSVKELSEQTKKIGEITSIINKIAEQTNLLALNAAIEAARAGEQGKGFAVVADEVRKLAEQSAQASENISRLVGNIQGQTDGVVDKIENGAQNLEKGMQTVQEALMSLEEIASVAQETAAGAEEVSAASEEQSAAMEEVTASAEQLAALGQNLQELISGKGIVRLVATKSDDDEEPKNKVSFKESLKDARERAQSRKKIDFRTNDQNSMESEEPSAPLTKKKRG